MTNSGSNILALFKGVISAYMESERRMPNLAEKRPADGSAI